MKAGLHTSGNFQQVIVRWSVLKKVEQVYHERVSIVTVLNFAGSQPSLQLAFWFKLAMFRVLLTFVLVYLDLDYI
jgi:hypothetical protein